MLRGSSDASTRCTPVASKRRSTTAPAASASQPATLVRRRQRVADGGDAAVGVEPDRDVTGERAVVLDGDLDPRRRAPGRRCRPPRR